MCYTLHITHISKYCDTVSTQFIIWYQTINSHLFNCECLETVITNLYQVEITSILIYTSFRLIY